IKVDFAFYPVKALEDLSVSLSDDYNAGYKVLVDKDSLTEKMPQASLKAFRESKPSEEEFHRVVNEFWFEAYHIAKYLKRDDLWSAKFRDWGQKDEFLLTMIRWNEMAKHSWDYSVHSQGKSMQKWVSSETWHDLHKCFSHFDAENSWKALENTLSLFRRIALEAAELLGYSYPKEVDRNLSEYVSQLKNTTFTS
ncbi:hypothetical protein HON58_03395, partial [Candidatus Peregrinibacteria bacterium]|nr:hypothetical protein [Candidatus Peregrinibacteria bacterium]